MENNSLDPRILGLLEVQRELIDLNKAGVIIRGVLPRGSRVVVALEHEIAMRFRSIQEKRRELAANSTEAGNAGK